MAKENGEKAELILGLIEQKRLKWGKNTLQDEMSQEILFNMAKMGMSNPVIAASFGMGVRTLQRRIKEYPEVRDAINKGRREGLGIVMNTAFALASTGLDPATTRWFVDKYSSAMETEADKYDEEESNIIDVSSNKSGPMTQDELKKIVGETFKSDPMLREDDEESNSNSNT